jgi:hypothetical protein
MEGEGWKAELKNLERELEETIGVITPSIKPSGILYHNFLKSYRDPDRGLEQALQIYPVYADIWLTLVDKLSSLAPKLPYIMDEAEVLTKVRERFEKVGNILRTAAERGGPLFPEEFAEILYSFSSFEYFLNYVFARLRVTLDVIKDILKGGKGDITPLLKKTSSVVYAFVNKVLSSSNRYNFFYMSEDPFLFAFIVLMATDAYTPCLLYTLTTAQNEREKLRVLKEYSLRRGLEELLFTTEASIIGYTRESLRKLTHREDLCLPRMLGSYMNAIDNSSRFLSYVKKLYSGLEKTSHPFL